VREKIDPPASFSAPKQPILPVPFTPGTIVPRSDAGIGVMTCAAAETLALLDE
jgi:hypothetical protein